MIKNYYYLIVGVLSILFAFTHAWNGQTNFLPIIDLTDTKLATKTTTFYVWHTITIENIIFGVAFLMMSVRKDPSKVKFAAWLIAFILIARWVVIFGSTLIKNKNAVADTLTDSIAIIIVVALIILGARKKGKVSA